MNKVTENANAARTEEKKISSKKPYEKPVITEKTGMAFTKEAWEDFSEGNWCFGCTNCNCT
jgi:hypothetical protein